MRKRKRLALLSLAVVFVGCRDGRLPDSVLWTQEGGGLLSAADTGELFVANAAGLQKLSAESGERLWEPPLNESDILALKAEASGVLVVMQRQVGSLLLASLSGVKGEELWSQAIQDPLSSLQAHEFGNARLDALSNLIVFGGLERTYLFGSDGSLRWDVPLARGGSAGATALLGGTGNVVRFEVVGEPGDFFYVLQAYDEVDGSPSWFIETHITGRSNNWPNKFISANLARSGDLVVASLVFRGELQVGETVLLESLDNDDQLGNDESIGVFAFDEQGNVQWARTIALRANGVQLASGGTGVMTIAGQPFAGFEIDGYKPSEGPGVLISLDTVSGEATSALGFYSEIGELTSDQHGRSYVTLEDRGLLVGLDR